MPPETLPGLYALQALLPVSRETYNRLALLVGLVKKWQKAENLVAPSTLSEIWTRHVADSAQLAALFPAARHWLDVGSGGGFPGLVTAILISAEESDGVVHLVESNVRKCAFLRTAARETGAPAIVHHGRIEEVLASWSLPVDIISARALAPLPDLFRLTGHMITRDRPATFPKGVDYRSEIDEASQSWDFDLVIHPSRISEGSVILEVRRAVPKADDRTSRP
jgi:16S rRNA (guanine527-N7)-methyltransferase